MPYLGAYAIDDFLTFAVNTHNNKGQARDADSVPTYRIYEEETAAPLLTGNMALLDDANTLGFYSEQIQLTAANGFEVGKVYIIYITATVQGTQGTISHTFQMPIVTASVDETSIANKILTLDWTGMTGTSSRSVLNALRFLRNKWYISGTTLYVTEEDDATEAWNSELSSDASADPITGSDPT